MTYKLVAFDMDGTLLTEKSSWWKMHRYFGTYKSSLKNMKAYEQGQIDYAEFMRRDIALWQPTPHIDTIKRILLDYDFNPNAEYVASVLKEKKYHIALITTGLDILANVIASVLQISYVLANALVFDEKGYLTGNVIFKVDLMEKHKAFNKLIAKIGIFRNECVAIGDSKYDITFLKSAGLGVAFKADSELGRVADITVTDLKELLNFL